ncbi:MAG: hypothetical protein M1825_003015 [Sarcosagium campestre]|nr:MAG: hypothetical protein M1825_003015 [Sarcosagium campestre]
MEVPKSLQDSVDASKAEFRQLGKSGLRISNPVLGTMSIGSSEWQDWVLDEDKALPLLKAAYDKGITTWDTANIYSNGASETVIGKALKKYSIPRDKVVIMSKCYGTVGDTPGLRTLQHGALFARSKDYLNKQGLSRSAIFTAVDASLARLGTNYIDVYQIHRFDHKVPIEETMEALHDLVKSGKVRYIGASSMYAYQFAMMQFVAEKHGWTKFISMQNHYSLLYREEEREMNAFCNLTGVGLIPWSPLARGHLARPPTEFGSTTRSASEKGEETAIFSIGQTEIDRKIADRVHQLAEKKGWTMTQVSLAWINKRVTSPIVGFSSAQRMDEALAARGKELTDEEEKFLEELYEPKAINGH